MKELSKYGLMVAGALLLTACAANKGGFDLAAVEPPANIKNDRPKLQDAPREPRTQEQIDVMFEPSLGVEVSLLEPNIHSSQGDYELSFNADSIVAIHDELDQLTERQIKELNASPRRSAATISGTHDDGNGFFASRDRDYLKFVKSGWITDLETKGKFNFSENQVYRGIHGSVFYLGKNPATAMPSGQVITYQGDWDYATNAVKSREPSSEFTSEVRTYPGQRHSALSYHESVVNDANLRQAGKHQDGSQPHSHSSEFIVDFDKKSLTGALKYNKYDQAAQATKTQDRYTIDAKLHGNRFRGSATAVNADDPYFGASSSTLEGGFFGSNAEELAGKFLTDNNSLFGVFGARQFNEGSFDNIAEATPMYDAVKMDMKDFLQSNLDTFGNANKLVINGRSFSLLSDEDAQQFTVYKKYHLGDDKTLNINVCCQNLDYLKFGNYYLEQQGDKQNSYLFLTGERTPLAQMTNSGKFEYAGTWEANILTQGQKVGAISPSQGAAGSRARFEVDFDSKALTGSLFQENGASPAIMIQEGVIRGNGFDAKFNSSPTGIVLDRVTGDSAHVSGRVLGGFYGPNAIELGGYFMSDADSQDKVQGVFGARKQVASQ